MMYRFWWLKTLLLLLSAAAVAWSEPELSQPVSPHVFTGDVSSLPAPRRWQPGDPILEIPRRAIFPTAPGGLFPSPESRPNTIDPLLQFQLSPAARQPDGFGTPGRDFEGGGFSGVNPPDANGDVGLNHYIQAINGISGTEIRIFDKSAPVPNLLAYFALDSLGSAECATGLGDPIVLYDRPADRWLLTEFSGTGNHLCIYVSRTSDPIAGGWYNYEYNTPVFPDYPKYSVWPTDANGGQGSYIMTDNEGTPVVYAFKRAALLSGSPGSYQRFSSIPALSGFNFQGVVAPANVNGPNSPPPGSAAPLINQRDTEIHGPEGYPGTDFLDVWELNLNWNHPANSLLTNTVELPIAEIDSALCGTVNYYCFPQPGTAVTLDPLREPMMNRLQYIHAGGHESIVGNFVTDTDGTDHGGMRWFELRGGAGAWTLYQEGTYAPDARDRWIGGIGIDRAGDIAMAYSISSSTVYPGIRYTGRLGADPSGTMTQPEATMIPGTASNGSSRWGDYAAMSLDPSDDCTFWYTGMYNASSHWSTRIASFKFDSCDAAAACIFCDEFNDSVLDWVYLKPQWSETTGSLMASPAGRTALATPPASAFPGCLQCSIEASIRAADSSSGGQRTAGISVFGWYAGGRANSIELLIKPDTGVWLVKQRVNGIVIAKNKARRAIGANTPFTARVVFDGTAFAVYADSVLLMTFNPVGVVHSGSMALQVKNTTAGFDFVHIN